MKRKTETPIVKSIIDVLNRTGFCYVWRQQSGFAKGGRIHMAPTGSTDVIGFVTRETPNGIARGTAIGIEVKTATGKRSPAQLEIARMMTDAGCVYGVCCSAGEALELIGIKLEGKK